LLTGVAPDKPKRSFGAIRGLLQFKAFPSWTSRYIGAMNPRPKSDDNDPSDPGYAEEIRHQCLLVRNHPQERNPRLDRGEFGLERVAVGWRTLSRYRIDK
jgi:hypothetical protein